MARAVNVNGSGYFAGDIYGDPEYTGKPGTAPAIDVAGLIAPRWDGARWVEGAAASAVDSFAEFLRAGHASKERAWRDEQLTIADHAVNDAQDRGDDTRAADWRRYRVALRDMPETSADPYQWKRPEAPQA